MPQTFHCASPKLCLPGSIRTRIKSLSRLGQLSCLALVLLTLLALSSWKANAAEPLPNIVLINADDLGLGDVSCYGAKALSTPNLDRLAAGGLRFTDGHASAATCTPSRYSMLTGEYAWRQRGREILTGDANLIIKPGSTTLASILSHAGYRTGIVGKWHLGLGKGKIDWNTNISPGPLDVGFDSQFIIPATLDRVPCVFLEGSKVRNLSVDDPIEVSYSHRVGDLPTGKSHPEMLLMTADDQHSGTIVNGVSRIGFMKGGKSALWSDVDMPDLIVQKSVDFLEESKGKPFFLYLALVEPHVPRIPSARFAGKTPLGPRGDVILQLDWIVGQVLDALDNRGLASNTIVIFTSDNGPVLNDGYGDQAVAKNGTHTPAGPYKGRKYVAYEGGTRVPFIVRWPEKIKPGVSDALVCQIDFPRTFAQLTGQSIESGAAPDSQNMLAPLLGETQQGRKTLVEEGVSEMGFRDGSWKLIVPKNPKKDAGAPTVSVNNSQLFNLAEDEGEKINLAQKDPQRLEAMLAQLQRILNGGTE
ncbi:arylsulfatase A [Terrimicrobium sacchariphilum]|uniref:Arylsulfatase A n=1 Tax=Terrimicrobium sacchariphilum TaxID=690879 RepID=A0A146G6L5_TERSA|nr:arylsulfatase [Terrimicrobium sacchariphilum]GAT33013.1 arylsulfatase A [Terrimicrobium sacchariphilum]